MQIGQLQKKIAISCIYKFDIVDQSLYKENKLGQIIELKKLFKKRFNSHFVIWLPNWLKSDQPILFVDKMNTLLKKLNYVEYIVVNSGQFYMSFFSTFLNNKKI